jgi:hypothetical protein
MPHHAIATPKVLPNIGHVQTSSADASLDAMAAPAFAARVTADS